ncbi:MAG TPA: glycerol kinase GlpK [Pyrinomonadaceae bacterium]|nr:glycerol kinase GlpK [Pyrinomonadaceae bacterium]
MSNVLAVDQGTTSSRSSIFDQNGSVVSLAQKEFKQLFPQSGWVEHDPEEIWRSQIGTAIEVLAKAGLSAKEVAAVGLTNQRETTIIWERTTGKPVHNAIVWQDRRTSNHCGRIRESHGEMIRQKTGLEVDAYFSASKIAWLLDNVAGVRERAENGELAFGTVDTWLVWKLTGGRLHVTDPSNASRTLLFNIHTLEWDDELLNIFGVPRAVLPEVRSSSELFGVIEAPDELCGIPITGIAGDQQAALFGQACFEPGATKNTYGTGCFMLQNIGETPVESKNRLLTTVGWKIGEKTEYALEGSVFIGGAVVQWLRDSLGIIATAAEIEKLAASVPNNAGVFFVPAFAGLGTPHWNQEARGTIIGLTRGTGRAHIARAALESIAFQSADLLDAMHADSGKQLDELRVDGGATSNSLLMQIQADLLQTPVVRAQTAETTALGAAYLAGLSAGVWESTDELAKQWQAGERFEPKMKADEAASLRSRWQEAVARSLNWAK